MCAAGIGLGIAQRLAQEGASVMISSRRQANVDDTVAALRQQGLDVRGVACHVGSLDQVQQLMQVSTCSQERGPDDGWSGMHRRFSAPDCATSAMPSR
jgi:dehydrogenase/reductase SDR family member 4